MNSKHIEIRHNSPDVVDLFASGSVEELIKALQHIYFILRPVVADLASIITLGGAVGVAGKLAWNKVSNNGAALRKKVCVPEVQKLRQELNKLLASSHEQLPTFRTNVESLLSEKLIGVTDCLKKDCITVTSLEIQFLDGKEDVLDILYHQHPDLPVVLFLNCNPSQGQ